MECSQHDTERACLEREITEETGEDRWQQADDEEGNGIDLSLNIKDERNKTETITKTFIGKVWKKRNKGEWRRFQEHGDHNY